MEPVDPFRQLSTAVRGCAKLKRVHEDIDPGAASQALMKGVEGSLPYILSKQTQGTPHPCSMHPWTLGHPYANVPSRSPFMEPPQSQAFVAFPLNPAQTRAEAVVHGPPSDAACRKPSNDDAESLKDNGK